MARVGQSAWDELEDESPETSFLIRTDAPIEEAMARGIAALSAEAKGPHLDDDPDDYMHFHYGLTPTQDGPAFFADKWHMDKRFPVMAAELDRAGLPDAVVESQGHDYPAAMGSFTRSFLECRLAIAGTRIPGWTSDDPRAGPDGLFVNVPGVWEIAEDFRAAVAGLAGEWCGALPAPHPRHFLSSEVVTSVVSGDRIGPMLELATRRWTPSRVAFGISSSLYTESGATYRQAELSVNRAHVSFIAGATTPDAFDWQASLAAVTEPLARAPWAVRGFVTRNGNQRRTCDQVLTETYGPEERDREEHGLPAALGAVVLPAHEAGRMPPGWTVTPYGPLILAVHPDPAAWFADAEPDPTLIETTRAALGSLIAPP